VETAAPGDVVRAALDRDLPDGLDPEALAAEAEEALVRDDPGPALAMLLDLAALHVRDGRDDAALDACYLALSVDPDDAGLHLALLELYDRRGWSTLANEKLDLLERLAALDADHDGAVRLAVVRAARS
jgi:Flp pilus assembly protein TadD